MQRDRITHLARRTENVSEEEVRVLVTGASGFVGKATCHYLLNQGADVRTFDRAIGHDVCNREQVLDYAIGCSSAVHLAGLLGTSELFDDADRAIDVNVRGALNVLRACKENGCRYTGITLPAVWDNIYSATKGAALRIANAYNRDHKVPVSHVLAYNVYGPGQGSGEGHPQKLFPTACVKLFADELVPVWGDGRQTVDLVHVDHVAKVLGECALGHIGGNREVFEAGCGMEMSVLEVIQRIGKVVGVNPRIQPLPMRKGETEGTRLCATESGYPLDVFSSSKFREAVESYRPSTVLTEAGT